VIVYEVNLRVRHEIAAAYRAWLGPHVDEMLALPGFDGAQVFSVRDGDDAETTAMCVQYRLRDADALERYLHEHAPRLRAEGAARFGDGFSAQRRVLLPLSH
jgi:hypothetical protein